MGRGMRVIAIGGKVFVTAFRLVGAEGVEVSSPREMLAAVRSAIDAGGVGLILLSDDMAAGLQQELATLKNKYAVPLIYELPAPGGKPRSMDYMQIVRGLMSA